MKILVVYFSQTGNTRKVAEAIFEVIEANKEIKPLEEIQSLEGYDLTFIGFPVLQFGPPRRVRIFLEQNSKGKNVALFATHASWNSPELAPLLEAWLQKCKVPAAEANLVGFFDCQGELSESSASQFLKSDYPQLRHFGSLRPMTLGHPDPNDLENARLFARETISWFHATHFTKDES